MKKTKISLLFCAFFTIILMCGCKFNLTDSKYLDRPDVNVFPGYFQIVGSYISNNTESITIYRQNIRGVENLDNQEIERVAVLFPKGPDTTENQTFHYEDYCVLADGEYRYYVRFTDENGVRNRTEWTAALKLQSGGATNGNQIAYTVNDLKYNYDEQTMIMTLPSGSDFTAPDSSSSPIPHIGSYSPALVFQTGDVVQVFKITDTTNVPLKALLPESFLHKDIKLLGIVGQYTEVNKKDDTIVKQISWTNLTPVTIRNAREGFIRLDPEHGEDGNDYSTISDNEN